MPDMRVALQVYTIREHLKTLESFAGAMKKVSGIGYRNVELAGVGPIDVKDQKKVLDAEELTPVATHTGYGEFRDRMDEVIAKHKLLGCEYTVVPGLPREYHSEEGLKKAAKEMSGFAARLAKAGLRLAYHNHSFEFQRFGSRVGMDILFGESDPKLVNSELDTYWVQHGGGSPVSWVRRLSGRVPLLHLKDMGINASGQFMAEVGEGNLEWPAIFAAAEKAGTQWLIVEQDTCQRPCLESIEVSFRNLKVMGMC